MSSHTESLSKCFAGFAFNPPLASAGKPEPSMITENIIERRRALNSKLLNVANEISFYNLAPRKNYSNGPYSQLDFKPKYYKYRRYNRNRFENEHQEYNNSYRGNRFQPNSNMFFNYPKNFHNSYRRKYKNKRNKFARKNPYPDGPKKCCLIGSYYECDCDKKNINNGSAGWQNYNYDGADGDWNMTPNNENTNQPVNIDPAEINVLNYCLDQETQHTIHRIQNDFRLTEKYKAFVLCEMPLINDFKPIPVVTRNRLNDRFKCLSKQILEEKPANAENTEAEKADESKANQDDDILERTADIDSILNSIP